MMNERNNNIQEIGWKEASEVIKHVDRELVDIIDSCDPPKDYTLFKASYRYGSVVLKEGILHLPDSSGRVQPINSLEIPSHIREKLSYSNFPLGIITKGSNEVFLEDYDRVVSLAFFKPKFILGLWETFDAAACFPRKIWSVYAGARSLYMLPKISDAYGNNKLKKLYNIKASIPLKLFDHADFFSTLTSSKILKNKNTWTNEVIFFTKKWLNQHQKQNNWANFRLYLMEQVWATTVDTRIRIAYDYFWQRFAKELERRRLKVSSYIISTLKHIIAIGLGVFPAYKPVGAQQFSGPVHLLQDVYVNDYGLKSYVPTVMEPHHFSRKDDVKFVYYSLQSPNSFETIPKNRNITKIIDEVRELKMLSDIFYEEALALSNKLKIENTALSWLVDNISIDYFHSEKDIHDEIRQSREMPQEDKSLIFTQHEYKNNNIFAENSPFVRGCVRLSKN